MVLPNIAMLPAAAGEIVDRRGLMPDDTNKQRRSDFGSRRSFQKATCRLSGSNRELNAGRRRAIDWRPPANLGIPFSSSAAYCVGHSGGTSVAEPRVSHHEKPGLKRRGNRTARFAMRIPHGFERPIS